MEDLVARPPEHRVIPVLVKGLAVSDGQAKLPVLGEVMGYHLTFTEATDSEAPDFVLVTVVARAHQNSAPDSQGLGWDGTPDSYPPEAGLAAARARGRHGGRKPKMTPALVDKAQRMYDSHRFTIAEIAQPARSAR